MPLIIRRMNLFGNRLNTDWYMMDGSGMKNVVLRLSMVRFWGEASVGAKVTA